MNHALNQTVNTVSLESKARYLLYLNQQFRNDDGSLKEGDSLNDNGDIIRYHNGFIHAEDEPAIECSDGHIEFWNNGLLHQEDSLPAVISEGGNHLEYWNRGVRVN